MKNNIKGIADRSSKSTFVQPLLEIELKYLKCKAKRSSEASVIGVPSSVNSTSFEHLFSNSK